MFWFLRKNKPSLDELGLIQDPRPITEKEKDYRGEEVMTFGAFPWREKSESEWHKYPIFNQDGSSSCVAQSVTKALGIENFLEEGKFVHFSARDIYTQRANFPGKGMWFHNGMELGYKKGATIEQLMPSQGVNESIMNKALDRRVIDKEIALVGKGGNYLTVPLTIDSIAQIVEPKGKPVLLGVKFGSKEWNREVPKLLVPRIEARYGHAVTVTNATMHKGKKALVIEDSWGIKSGIDGRRIVTEDWFTQRRIVAAHYYLALKNDWRKPKEELKPPKANFKKDLRYGNKNNDVKMLQDCLKYEQVFPFNVESTSYYGNVTAKAVYDFQIRYMVAPKPELDSLGGRLVGPSTRAKLNSIYK